MSDLARALLAELDDATLDVLAERLAPRLAHRLDGGRAATEAGEWLNPAAAARHLGVSRQRIYDLKSAGALPPDGNDGRTPLWRRSTLDEYAVATDPLRVAP